MLRRCTSLEVRAVARVATRLANRPTIEAIVLLSLQENIRIALVRWYTDDW